MSVSRKRIERLSEKYDVPISMASDSGDILNVRTKSMMKFRLIAAELAWDDDLSNLKMVMVGDR